MNTQLPKGTFQGGEIEPGIFHGEIARTRNVMVDPREEGPGGLEQIVDGDSNDGGDDAS